jgi:hypothetical protein
MGIAFQPVIFFVLRWGRPDQSGSTVTKNDGGMWKRARKSFNGIQSGEWVSFKVDPSGFYGLLGVRLVIQFDEYWRVDLIGVFPSVITFRVPLPFDQIL